MGRGGGLQELEQQAGTFGVERVVGDAQGDLGKGDLDGAEIDEHREGEGFGRGGVARAMRGWPGGVMVVTELLVAEGKGVAAVAVGVEMLAAGGGGRWHEVFLSVGGSG
jgi:hypothetical protein